MLKDNLGDNWEEACITLMSEMRMFELECLRRRMEDKKSETLQRLAQSQDEVVDVEEITFAENHKKYVVFPYSPACTTVNSVST